MDRRDIPRESQHLYDEDRGWGKYYLPWYGPAVLVTVGLLLLTAALFLILGKTVLTRQTVGVACLIGVSSLLYENLT